MRLAHYSPASETVPAEWIDENVPIPVLLRVVPDARRVLDRYGLQGCGGECGPAESIGFFARAHDMPIARLLDEIRDSNPQSGDGPREHTTHLADAIYRPFFKTGIAVVLTLGAVWGAYLLLRIAWTGQFGAAGLHEINAHGHAQIFGWVGLFVMGFAYQAFPRFKHAALAFPRFAWSSLWLMLAGVVGRSLTEPLINLLPWAGGVAIASAWIEVAAIGLFVFVILATWRAAGKGLALYDGYIVAALTWFLFQAAFEAIYLAATLAAANTEELVGLVATWQGALRDAQIHGFALLMILGVSQRILHHFYGLPAPNRRLSVAALILINLAVVAEMIGLVMMRSNRAWAGVWYGGAVVLAVAVVALVWNWRVFGCVAEADRSLKFLRAAYAWLLMSLAMLLALPAYQFVVLPWLAPTSAAASLGFSHAYYGAVRHAITVGFVSLMIVGVAARVVPTLNGVDVNRLSRLWGPFLLINLGCAMRVVGQTLTDFSSNAFVVAGISGVLEVTGLALWGIHLWAIMAGRPRYRRSSKTVYVSGTPIDGQHMVGDVLERHPELLETFLALGFKPLANPLLRNTVARTVTIAQASRRLGLAEGDVVAALNRTRTRLPNRLRPLPMA
jgi:hypothetical protein